MIVFLCFFHYFVLLFFLDLYHLLIYKSFEFFNDLLYDNCLKEFKELLKYIGVDLGFIFPLNNSLKLFSLFLFSINIYFLYNCECLFNDFLRLLLKSNIGSLLFNY